VILSNARIGERLLDIRIARGLITEIGVALDGGGDGDGGDLEGRWVSPGLWDNHVHFTQWTLTSQRVDVSAAASAVDAAALIAAALTARALAGVAPASQPLLVGTGFRDALWPDAPTREILDRATAGVPTVLVSGDLHAVWLNSAAIVIYGPSGHPTGLLTEDAAFEVQRKLGTVPDEVADAWARSAALAAARRGVVGIVDFEMTWNLEVWQRRMTSGHHSLRVEFAIYPQHLERAIAEGLRTGNRVDELLSVGGFKVLADGSLNTRTAHTIDPYEDGSHGELTVPPAVLVPLMRRASDAGIRPDIHAIGDRANTIVLDAFETIDCGGRIEHAQLLAESDLPRFARLGVVASVQPEHAMDDRDVAERYWPDGTARMYPLRSLLDAGATLLLGSDAPVAPLDPWVAIAAAVSRQRDGREPWHSEQRISTAEALAASTRTTIAVGQPADLVITELNPLTATGDELRAMPVAATLLAGRFTHRA